MDVRLALTSPFNPIITAYNRTTKASVGSFSAFADPVDPLRTIAVSLSDGDYDLVCLSPPAVYCLRISGTGTAYVIGDTWADLTAGGGSVDNAAIADAVWDELLSGHAIAGSAGAALTGAGSAGDPWSTLLPGAYGAGTAGKIIGDKIVASVTGSVASVVGGVGGNVAGSVASVVGNVGGNVTGSVGSVTGNVGGTVANVVDKTGYSLSAAGVTAIWSAMTSALTTASTIGKLLVDNVNATISSRSTYAGTDTPGTTTLVGLLTSARAGYLDNLNVGGAVSSLADINALNQSASRRIILQTVGQYERPESGSTVYTVEVRAFDGDGAPLNADANPTLTATGQTTGSLSVNIGVITNPSTGVYRWTYTVASGATVEPVRFDVASTIGGGSFPMSIYTQVVDLVSATWTATNASNLTAIFNKLPSSTFLAGTGNASGSLQMNNATGNFSGTVGGVAGTITTLDGLNTSQNAQHSTTQSSLTNVSANVSTLLGRISSTLFTGITSLRSWLGLLAGKASDPTTLLEVQATAGGAGYNNGTDSLEGLRDRGDAAWLTGSSTGGQFTVPITVRDDETLEPIPGAVVTVTSAGTIVAWLYSDAIGVARFSLNAGNYTINCTARGFASVIDQALIVTASSGSIIAMISQSISPPPVAGLCNILFSLIDAGQPVAGAKVRAELLSGDGVLDGYLVARSITSGVTDSAGQVTLTLIQAGAFVHGSGTYKIVFLDADGRQLNARKVRVPSLSTCLASDLIDVTG